MTANKITRMLILLMIVAVNIGCDQVSKKMIRENISFDQSIRLLNDHLTITKVENSGAFMSLGETLTKTTRRIFLSALPILALILGLIYVFTRKTISQGALLGIGFMIGGGIGNVFDRVVNGSVTDFLYLQFGFLHTGVFNLADLSIMAGAGMLLIHHLLSKKTG